MVISKPEVCKRVVTRRCGAVHDDLQGVGEFGSNPVK
jgi:hypothetical protein